MEIYLDVENVLEAGRNLLSDEDKNNAQILNLICQISYDLQSGKYVSIAENNKELVDLWCKQASDLITKFFLRQILLWK